jgi:uncharacterized membrane protein
MNSSKRSISKRDQPGGGTKTIGIMERTTTSFVGPLPSPEILQGFENVVPGAAERIIVMAEKEQDTRLRIEKRILAVNIVMVILGIVSGLVALLVISFLIKYSMDKGYPNVASILASTSLLGVVGIFVWFRKKKKSG